MRSRRMEFGVGKHIINSHQHTTFLMFTWGQVMMTWTNQSLALRAHRLSPALITHSPTHRPSISKPKSPIDPGGSAHLRTSPAEGVGGMSDPHAPPHAPRPAPLYKQRSWSPDTYRDEAWQRRKGNNTRRSRRLSKSVTDEDLDELKACIELGFGFDSPDMDKRLSDTLPALGLYYAVNKQYVDAVTKSSSPSSSTVSDCDPPSPLGSPHTIFGPGDNPHTVKTRLRHWAQVVACSVRQSSG